MTHYGYARVSTDGQSVEAQVRQLTKAGCKKVFRETASGAKMSRITLLAGLLIAEFNGLPSSASRVL